MQGFKWSLSLVIIAVVLQTAIAAPSIRIKRQDVQELGESSDALDELNPIEVEVSDTNGLDREKRKLPETFEAKNAILGFVFGQVDNVIDTKTRILDRLEQANIEKNRQYNITLPPPIKDFQGLVTAVVSPKLTAITSKITGLTAGIFGGANNNGDSPAAQGLGQIVTKFLRFSGPIFQGSAGNPPTKEDPESDEAGY